MRHPPDYMRVAIASGERLFLDGLVDILTTGYLSIVIHSADPRECIRHAKEAEVDLLVVDLRSATPNDVDFILGAQSFGTFLTLGITDEDHPLPDGLTAGVARTDSAEALLAKAMELTAHLQLSRPTPKKRRAAQTVGGTSLSKREFETARLIADGFTNRAIANALQLKEQSVKNLVSTIIRKLRCENRVQVALRMREQAAATTTFRRRA